MRADSFDPAGWGEMNLIGCIQPAARILARYAVPQLGAAVFAFADRARAGWDVEELAADFAITPTEAQVLIAHLECWPGVAVLAARRRAAARARRPSFIEKSQPEER